MNKKIKSFKGQIKKAFLIVIVTPVLLFSGFLIYFTSEYIKNKSDNKICNLIEQNRFDLYSKIESCEKSIRYLTANYELKNFLLIDDKDYLQLGRKSKNINNILYSIFLSNNYFSSLTLYTDKDFQTLTEFLKPIDEIKNEYWYDEIIKLEGAYWWSEDDKIYIGRKIMSSYPLRPIGVLKIQVSKDMFYDSFHIFKDIPIKIQIYNFNESVYTYTGYKWQNNPKFNKKISFKEQNLNIKYTVDKSYYREYTFLSQVLPILLIIFLLIITWGVICHFSKKLVKDLFVLVNEVEEVKKGNLNKKISKSKIKEIDILGEAIQDMLLKITNLIDEVYNKEIQRQELEINLLQSKIKPHFLYNNLSAINWIALETGQDKIYTISTELANFYRTALNKGKNIDKIAIEVENIKAYIKLQLIAHDYNFKVEYNIEDEVLDYNMPIFILQPLVENAIEHGIDLLIDKEGVLKIIIFKELDEIKIIIEDNGDNLYNKIGNKEFLSENFGYATYNINKRLELIYGDKNSLKIFASSRGTKAIITIKIKG